MADATDADVIAQLERPAQVYAAVTTLLDRLIAGDTLKAAATAAKAQL